MQVLHPDNIQNKTILFSALNWGYGHVMRSLILVKKLQKQGNRFYIVGNEEQIRLYTSENLDAIFIKHEGYPFQFKGNGDFSLDLLKSLFKLKKHYKKEHDLVEKLCKKRNIDLVLADQSLGFYSEKVQSVLITHQVNLPLTLWQKPAQWLYDKQLSQFNFLWIPDQKPPNNLAGKLSQTRRENVAYLGFLSRFTQTFVGEKIYDVGVLVTGPQPYAQQFFEANCKRFENSKSKVFIVYNGTDLQNWKNIKIFQHQTTSEMAKLLSSAELVISRSGYSTLMDFMALGIQNVELYPTPGQAEQVYLKERWKLLND